MLMTARAHFCEVDVFSQVLFVALFGDCSSSRWCAIIGLVLRYLGV